MAEGVGMAGAEEVRVKGLDEGAVEVFSGVVSGAFTEAFWVERIIGWLGLMVVRRWLGRGVRGAMEDAVVAGCAVVVPGTDAVLAPVAVGAAVEGAGVEGGVGAAMVEG